MKHNLWVTPYARDEMYPGGEFPNQNPRVGEGLATWVKQNRSLEEADVVLWLVLFYFYQQDIFITRDCVYSSTCMREFICRKLYVIYECNLGNFNYFCMVEPNLVVKVSNHRLVDVLVMHVIHMLNLIVLSNNYRYVFGVTHIPRLEDWPVMPVDRIGFMLMVFHSHAFKISCFFLCAYIRIDSHNLVPFCCL